MDSNKPVDRWWYVGEMAGWWLTSPGSIWSGNSLLIMTRLGLGGPLTEPSLSSQLLIEIWRRTLPVFIFPLSAGLEVNTICSPLHFPVAQNFYEMNTINLDQEAHITDQVKIPAWKTGVFRKQHAKLSFIISFFLPQYVILWRYINRNYM